MKTKTIILSSPNNEGNARGILTLYMEDDLLKCKLRLYSAPTLNRYCKLGVYHKGQVYSSNFIERAGVYYSSLVGDFDMDADFYTALVLTDQENKVLLAGGTYAGYFLEDTEAILNSDEFNSGTGKNDEDERVEYEECTHNLETKCIDADEDKCTKCKYKEFFYSNFKENLADYNENAHKNTTTNIDAIKTNEKSSQTYANYSTNTKENDKENKSPTHSLESITNVEHTHSNNVNEESEINVANNSENSDKENNHSPAQPTQEILSQIVSQFNYVFENYPTDDELNSRIENGKFVKVQDGTDNYSIGAIYSGGEMEYICYAVARNYNEPAPEELGKYYQWLPLDSEDPLSAGYYIVYQSAKDLKIVEI